MNEAATYSSAIVSVSLQSFSRLDVKQAFFMRHGGVSQSYWASLNQGGMLGDQHLNVVENRKRIFDAFGRTVASIYDVWQVHGIEVVCADQPRPLQADHVKADAILTNRPEITLMMRFADCVPIMFYDPVKKVVGIAHAGWQGTIRKICKEVVEKMINRYSSEPENIMAGIGPSIGPECYEIGNEVQDKVRESFGNQADNLLIIKNNRIYLDLWKANRFILREAGIKSIESLNICTACNTKDWYSHRAEKGKTGRFGALIALRQPGEEF